MSHFKIFFTFFFPSSSLPATVHCNRPNTAKAEWMDSWGEINKSNKILEVYGHEGKWIQTIRGESERPKTLTVCLQLATCLQKSARSLSLRQG